MMDEDIRSAFLFDETETFFFVKPFYDAIGHNNTLLS
jgi:hypothetical protein